MRDVPTVARVAREIGGAPVVGEDARRRGCASDAASRHYTRPRLFVFLLLRSQSHGPARDIRPWRAARRARFAAPGSRTTAPRPRPTSRQRACRALPSVSTASELLLALVPGPTFSIARVAELIKLRGKVLVPGVGFLV